MDGLTIALIVILYNVLIITVVLIILLRRRQNRNSSPPPAVTGSAVGKSGAKKAPAPQPKGSPPANVSVVFLDARSTLPIRCRYCGCEQAAAAVVCELCGEQL